jgi:RNA polymerase sigma-70 factor (ECF subfamily)
VTNPPTYPEELLAQTDWLKRLTRELVPIEHSADLVQETLVAALERPMPTKAAVRTWLERIARNLAAGGTRARYRRLRRERDAAHAGAEPSTADTLAEFEMHRSVVDAVRSLRDPIRTTLLLRFWEDLPPRAIAKRMQAPVETVRTRIKRGLQELRGSLDAQHGRREAWSFPLLTFSMGRRAIAAPASLAISTSVLLMNIKALAIAAIVVLGIVGAFAWNANQLDVPSPHSKTKVALLSVEVEPNTTTSTSRNAMTEQPTIASNERTSVASRPIANGEWLEGTVTDERLNPLADVEVSWLTGAQANKFRRPTGPELSPAAVQLDRTRWTLWHLSDRNWMHRKVLLGDIFEGTFVSRTLANGSFRIRRADQQERAVLALWSPAIGCRFHALASPKTHQQIVCKQWPSLRGHVINNGDDLTELVEVTVDYNPPRGGRALQFRADASGFYHTPQIPPGMHVIGFRAKNHHYKTEQFDLREDAIVDATLTRLPRLHTLLIDTAGRRWTSERFAALGWRPEQMQFLLTREDFQTETDLSGTHHPRSAMKFTADKLWLQGFVEDDQALALSVWQGRERIAAAQLSDHNVEEVVIDFPQPKSATTLDVRVSLGNAITPLPEVHLALGTMWGLGRYNFRIAAQSKGARDRFELNLPGYLRGQTAQLVVVAEGFSEQTVDVAIPTEGSPQLVRVNLPTAAFTLVGKVIDENNQPVGRARIRIATAQGDIFRSRVATFTRTDEHGGFRFTNLTSRHVRVFVGREGFASTSALTWTNREGPAIIRLPPGVQREIDISDAGDELVMLRVLDSQGDPLNDDRIYGAVHGGKTTQARLSIHAYTAEIWTTNGTQPLFTVNLQ